MAFKHEARTDAFYILKNLKQAESEGIFPYISWCQATECVTSVLRCKVVLQAAGACSSNAVV